MGILYGMKLKAANQEIYQYVLEFVGEDSDLADRGYTLLAFLADRDGEDFDMDYVEDSNFSHDYDYTFSAQSEEWIVATDDEADTLAKENVINLIDDMGLQSFSESFQEEIINDPDLLNTGWFDDAMRESYESYVYDMDEEELEEVMESEGVETQEDLIETYIEQYSSSVEWFKDNFGEEALAEAVTENGLMDKEAVAEQVISYDGRGMQLASYDHDEHEMTSPVTNTYYFLYRSN